MLDLIGNILIGVLLLSIFSAAVLASKIIGRDS